MGDGEMKERNGSCAAENFSKGRTAPSAVYDCNHNRLRGEANVELRCLLQPTATLTPRPLIVRAMRGAN